MAWSNEDREMLELIVERGVAKAVAPMERTMLSLNQTVNGTEKEPGLVGKMEDTRKRLSAVENFTTKVVGIAVGVTTVTSLAITAVKAWFGK